MDSRGMQCYRIVTTSVSPLLKHLLANGPVWSCMRDSFYAFATPVLQITPELITTT